MAYTEEMTTSEILLRLASMRNALLQAVNDIEKISKNICYKAEQTEPNCSEFPNNCDTCRNKGFEGCEQPCLGCGCCGLYEPKTEPQTERIKTLDYCDICNHKGCDNCIANNLDDYCVPSGYEPTTQTETQNSNMTFEKRTMLDCYNCKRFETEDECIECRYEPKDEPQTDCDHKCIQTEIGCEKPDCPWT